MLIKGYHQIKVPMILNLILVLVFVTCSSVNGLESRKLDDTNTLPATNGSTDEKCTPCGGGGSYAPPPPPPAIPPPSPPPPSPKKSPPSSQYNCPPPPSSFIYITGPPGNLYPVDENFSGGIRRHCRSLAAVLVGFMSMMAVFW